jgi:PPM family protein phosphatase
MVVVESSGLTDVGLKRKGNEDALFYDDDLKLFVVADGMGGHQAGEIASDLVVKTMKDYMVRFNQKEAVEELADSDKTLSKDANRLISGINLSNQVVYQAALNKRAFQGMGATLSAVYFSDDTLIASNVGDSPIYLIRNQEIEVLSVPHTVLAEQIALNQDQETRFGKEYSHMLTRAMGVDEAVRPDICELQCFKGDILVIASDGLTNKVSPGEISQIVQTKKPAKACRILVDMANQRGGDDNITLIVIKVKQVLHQQRGFMNRIFRFIRRG